jgi:1,4-dihydroxy-2-naphthoyl-CoA hydrolase
MRQPGKVERLVADEPGLGFASDFMAAVGLRFDEVGSSRVTGHLDPGRAHHQPWGVVHGGVYASAIETTATMGAYCAVRECGGRVVGITHTTHSLRPHGSGRLVVEARPLHQGKTTQL